MVCTTRIVCDSLHRRVHFPANQFPGSYPGSSRRMTSFDPATVRQAVAEFTPLRPQKFQDLSPGEGMSSSRIEAEGAPLIAPLPNCSRNIACRSSKTAIATFCHQVLTVKLFAHADGDRIENARPRLSPSSEMVECASAAQPEPAARPIASTRTAGELQWQRRHPQTRPAVARVSRRFGCSNLKPS